MRTEQLANQQKAIKFMKTLIKRQEYHAPVAFAELLAYNQKQTHWIWYIFPQLSSLGRSETSVSYGFKSKSDIRYFCSDSLAMGNLHGILDTLLSLRDSEGKRLSIQYIFPGFDSRKVQSCLTLFSIADELEDENVRKLCNEALDVYYKGRRDENTIKRYNELPNYLK